MAGTRRDYFVAETELKKLVGGFIREELAPHLESGTERLEAIQDHLPGDSEPGAQFFKDRVGKLGTWHKRTEMLLPIIRKFLS